MPFNNLWFDMFTNRFRQHCPPVCSVGTNILLCQKALALWAPTEPTTSNPQKWLPVWCETQRMQGAAPFCPVSQCSTKRHTYKSFIIIMEYHAFVVWLKITQIQPWGPFLLCFDSVCTVDTGMFAQVPGPQGVQETWRENNEETSRFFLGKAVSVPAHVETMATMEEEAPHSPATCELMGVQGPPTRIQH